LLVINLTVEIISIIIITFRAIIIPFTLLTILYHITCSYINLSVSRIDEGWFVTSITSKTINTIRVLIVNCTILYWSINLITDLRTCLQE